MGPDRYLDKKIVTRRSISTLHIPHVLFDVNHHDLELEYVFVYKNIYFRDTISLGHNRAKTKGKCLLLDIFSWI